MTEPVRTTGMTVANRASGTIGILMRNVSGRDAHAPGARTSRPLLFRERGRLVRCYSTFQSIHRPEILKARYDRKNRCNRYKLTALLFRRRLEVKVLQPADMPHVVWAKPGFSRPFILNGLTKGLQSCVGLVFCGLVESHI